MTGATDETSGLGRTNAWLARLDPGFTIVTLFMFLVLLMLVQRIHVGALLPLAQEIANPYKEGVNLYIAIGTGLAAMFAAVSAGASAVLAFFTWQTVRYANAAGADERLRHQQSMAPILELNLNLRKSPSNVLDRITIRNVGPGLAQQVAVEIRGSFRTAYANDPETHLVRLTARRAILGGHDAWEDVFPNHPALDMVVSSSMEMIAAISYADMFNNVYYTTTEDITRPGAMEWYRPRAVYPARSYYEAQWADLWDMSNVIDRLQFNTK
jgi:hypothetical protein